MYRRGDNDMVKQIHSLTGKNPHHKCKQKETCISLALAFFPCKQAAYLSNVQKVDMLHKLCHFFEHLLHLVAHKFAARHTKDFKNDTTI